MRRGFKHIVRRRLNQLPSHAPEEKQWGSIEQLLDTDMGIRARLSGLPVYEPDPAIWKAISFTLPVTKKTIPLHRLGQIAVAASIIFVLSYTWIMQSNRGLTVETELLQAEGLEREVVLHTSRGNEETDPIHTIEALCTSGAPICQTELFVDKLALYTELSKELEHLEGVIGKLGESPELVYSVIKIENMKSNALQELIGLIHS